jgi:hypothetical protein
MAGATGVTGWAGSGVAASFPPAVSSSILGNGNPQGGLASQEGSSSSPAPQGGGLSTFGNVVLDADGKAVELKGVAWSGFDTGTTLAGLEQVSPRRIVSLSVSFSVGNRHTVRDG